MTHLNKSPLPSFPPATRQALFDAILVNDVVDPVTPLPEHIRRDFTAQEIADCFAVSVQVWRDGFDPPRLKALAATIASTRDARGLQPFKHVRARCKHLRFAAALYGQEHRYPWLFNRLTIAMGHFQDAVKHRRRMATALREAQMRMVLSSPGLKQLEHEIGGIHLIDAAGFNAYLDAEMTRLAETLDSATLTGAQFHATRKIVSRMVSFYDSLRTTNPSENARLMSRALAAVNGLMGELHDQLVEQRITGEHDYHKAPIPWPEEICARVEALTTRFAQSRTTMR